MIITMDHDVARCSSLVYICLTPLSTILQIFRCTQFDLRESRSTLPERTVVVPHVCEIVVPTTSTVVPIAELTVTSNVDLLQNTKSKETESLASMLNFGPVLNLG